MSDNSGPAYPRSNKLRCGDVVTNGHTGMSLRDYFAAKAMQSLIQIYWEDVADYDTAAQLIKSNVESAYEYADAMLAEREK